jgi:hypothetical protein
MVMTAMVVMMMALRPGALALGSRRATEPIYRDELILDERSGAWCDADAKV